MLVVVAGTDIGLGERVLLLVLMQEPAEMQDFIGMCETRKAGDGRDEFFQIHREELSITGFDLVLAGRIDCEFALSYAPHQLIVD